MKSLNKSALLGTRSSKYIKESDANRRYQALEKITEKLEIEKRESIMMDQQIEVLQKEMDELLLANNSLFPGGSTESQLRNKIIVLEKKLELETTHLNESKSQNRLIRNEVNGIRKDKGLYSHSIKNLNSTLVNCLQRTEEKHNKFARNLDMDSVNRNQIKALRSKSVKNTNNYSQKLGELSFFITEEREKGARIRKRIEDGINLQLNKPGEFIYIASLLQKLLLS